MSAVICFLSLSVDNLLSTWLCCITYCWHIVPSFMFIWNQAMFYCLLNYCFKCFCFGNISLFAFGLKVVFFGKTQNVYYCIFIDLRVLIRVLFYFRPVGMTANRSFTLLDSPNFTVNLRLTFIKTVTAYINYSFFISLNY